MTNGIPLGCPLLLPVGTVNSVQTLKAQCSQCPPPLPRARTSPVRVGTSLPLAKACGQALGNATLMPSSTRWAAMPGCESGLCSAGVRRLGVVTLQPLITPPGRGPSQWLSGTVRVFHHGFCCVRVKVIGLQLLYGACYSAGIYTRGCH
jgi:hypothetical protein